MTDDLMSQDEIRDMAQHLRCHHRAAGILCRSLFTAIRR